jgi:hypothetical protein
MHFLLININRVQDSRYWLGKKQHADCPRGRAVGCAGVEPVLSTRRAR